MSKRKDRRQGEALFAVVARSAGHDDTPIDDATLAASPELASLVTVGKRPLTMMKKFRFQLLHAWIVGNVAPCRVADVGGGKGLLAYLLQNSGYSVTVIDPVAQGLPDKYKDLAADRQVKVPPTDSVPRLDQPFDPALAEQFDLLVAMHAHGCNLQLIDAAAERGCAALLLPCCVIGEPLVPPPGVSWLQCVVDYARERGFAVTPFRLNFKGQNIGLYLTAREH